MPPQPDPPAAPSQPAQGYQQTWAPPGPQLPPGELSGWWRRVGASLVDNVLVLLACALIFFITWAGSGDEAVAAVSAWAGYVTISLFLYGLVYAPFFMKRPGERNGQTLGKQALGIRVVRLDGKPMNYGTGALREWVARTLIFQLAAAFLFALPTLLDLLWPLWDERNQSLHDKIATTVVMRA